ncbi:MAG: hypothetical protein IK057_06550 [Clostridia bacterium]|nr:hypothetical protein [Clostridia bacterium]
MTKKVTIWHNGERQYLPLLSARKVFSSDKNGIKQKGFFDSSSCTLRISAKEETDLSVGDFVRMGEHTGDADRYADYKVMKIFENLRGTTPHYKLVCER